MGKEKPILMVVDDEVDLADNISHIIKESKRYQVITVYSAAEALRMLKENKEKLIFPDNPIRLIILDIKMPGMDGLEFLAVIRKEYSSNVGVLMLTAYEDEEKFQKTREGGVIGYIAKPFKNEQLLDTIDRFFEGKDKWMIEESSWETLAREKGMKAEADEELAEWRKGKGK